MDALRNPTPFPSPAAPVPPSPGTASDPAPARLTPDPFGLTALGGNAALRVFSRDGAQILRLQLHGQAVDLECDDDARDALVALLARAPR